MINYALLIAALIQVESAGNDQAIGDDGKAVGCLQLHEIFVHDANRILGTTYTGRARYDRNMSIHMARAWLDHYENHYRQCTGKEPTMEIMARIFNQGYRGYFRNSHASDAYWSKVQRELGR